MGINKFIFKFFSLAYFRAVWNFSRQTPNIYLTFDDGPTPEITEDILTTLQTHKAKATFFCLGKQVEKYPDLFEQIEEEGHQIGNHGYEHLDGTKTRFKDYIENVRKGFEITGSQLFRPPYGRLTPRQYFYLKKKYNLAFWDVMCYDWDKSLTLEQKISHTLNSVKKGSIIVFHDTQKASPHNKKILECVLSNFQEDYAFPTINLNVPEKKVWNLYVKPFCNFTR